MGKNNSVSEDGVHHSSSKVVFGAFYQIDTNGDVTIHHAGLMDFLAENHFLIGQFNGADHLLRIENNIIAETNVREVIQFVDKYVDGLPDELGNGARRKDLRNTLVKGCQVYFDKMKFNFLPSKEIVTHRHTRSEAYFYYANCFVKVNADEITVHSYSELSAPIWKNQMKQRNFTKVDLALRESEIEQFLFNVCNKDESRYDSLKSILGYMLHNYKDLKLSKAIILVDEEIGELGEANGGTGKSIIAKILIHMGNGVLIPGKNFHIDKSFAFERVVLGTDLIIVDDARLNENLEKYYNIITDGMTVERKHKGEYFVPFDKSPKLLITTNHVIKSPQGNSSERRKIEFEVSPFYHSKHTPEDDFKKTLFQDWDEVEWNQFDNAVVKFVQFYLKNGIIEPPKINIVLRKLLNDVGAELCEFMDDKISEGCVKFHKKDTHDEFIRAYPDLRKYYASTNRFTTKMRRYFTDKQIQFSEHPANTKKYFILEPKGEGGGGVAPDGKPNADDEPPPAKAKLPGSYTGVSFLTLKDVPHEYHIVDTAAKRKKLIELLLAQTSFTFDTETTDIKIRPIEIVGMSIAVKPHEAYCIHFPTDHAEAQKILTEFRQVFENEQIEKVGHNLKFDMQVLLNYDVKVRGRVFDTMLGHYLLFPDVKKHGLKPLCESFLNYRQVYYEDIVGKGKNEKPIREVPLEQLAEYAAEDADFTLQLKEIFAPMLKDTGLEKLFLNIEMPLVTVLADMEREGVKLDVARIKELLEKTDTELSEKEKIIYGLAGEEFNINSVRDINRILFEKLGITPIGKKGKSGYYSVDAENLQKLSGEHEIVPYISAYKGLSSIRVNFFEKLPKLVDPVTGRIHTKYNQAIAATGRLSSSKPNLQNVPKKSEGLGSLVRSAFVPRDDKHVIVSADYSQIELRVMAHLSGDKSLTDAFLKGHDVHSATAAKIYGVPVEEIGKNDPRRKIAKSVNFGLNYGMTEYGLSKRLTAETGRTVSESEAREIIETYFENFTGVKSFMEKAVFDATNKGFAETLFNRRRALPELNSPDRYKREAAKRIAVNVPIQGTAADLIKIAMNNLYQKFITNNMSTKMIMQIHDELVVDVPKAELETATAIIKKVMESAANLTVPLIVDIGKGDNWLAAH